MPGPFLVGDIGSFRRQIADSFHSSLPKKPQDL